MTENFVVLEREVKLFLIDKGITIPIFLDHLPVDAPDQVILIRTAPSGEPIPIEAPVDSQRVEVTNRDKRFETEAAITKANEIANIIHGATPGKLHPTSTLSLLAATLDERPQKNDDVDKDRPQFTAFYVFRVKPL